MFLYYPFIDRDIRSKLSWWAYIFFYFQYINVMNVSRLLLQSHDPRHRYISSKHFNLATEPCHACGLEGGSNQAHLSTHLKTYVKDNYWWGSITFDKNMVMKVGGIDCCKRCKYWSCKDLVPVNLKFNFGNPEWINIYTGVIEMDAMYTGKWEFVYNPNEADRP